MNDAAMLRCARSLADALAEYAYTRKDEDKKKIAELHTELCTIRRSELATPVEGSDT